MTEKLDNLVPQSGVLFLKSHNSLKWVRFGCSSRICLQSGAKQVAVTGGWPQSRENRNSNTGNKIIV